MSASPGYLRLATSSARSVASAAFDNVRDAVLVVNVGARHLPIVLANAAARAAFLAETTDDSLLEEPLYGWLSPASASALAPLVERPGALDSPGRMLLTWRLKHGEPKALATEVRSIALGSAGSHPGSAEDGGSRLVMLSFSPPGEAPPLLEQDVSKTVSVLILDRELRVLHANPVALASSAVADGAELIGRSVLDLAPTHALPQEVYLQALEGHGSHHQAMWADAALQYEVDVQPLRSAREITGVVVMYTPTGDGRRLSTPLDQTLHRLQMLTENARDIMNVVSADGRLLYVSGGVRNALGYELEERYLQPIFEKAHPDDEPQLRARFKQLVTGQIKRFSMEYRVLHKDGCYRWLEGIFVSALDDPIINGIVINARDITERKEAEHRFEQREEVFRLASEAVDGIIFEWDISKGISLRSRAVHQVLGFEPGELQPTVDAWRARMHPLDMPEALRKIRLALIAGRGYSVTYRIRDARGRYRSMFERGLIQRTSEGLPLRAIGCAVDISEIRRLTDLLAETQRSAQIGGWEYSYSNRELTWTDEMYRILDTTPQSFGVSWEVMLAQCTPDSRRRFNEACVRAEVTDGQFDLQLEIDTCRGRRIWVRMIGHLEMLEGRPFRAYGSMQNIQAQKLAQIALENSTGWLKLSMNMANMHPWRWDKATDEIEYAITDGQRVNLPDEYPNLEVFLGRLHPQDRIGIARMIDQAFKYRCDVREEFRLKGSSGRYRHFTAVARPLFDAAGAPSGLVGITQDVTAQRESETKLRRSEQLLRVTTTNTDDTIMLVDPELRIRFINRSLAGRAVEEIVGADFAEFLPAHSRSSVLSRLRQVLATGETAHHDFECEAESWDGRGPEPQFLEYRAVLVRDEGAPTGISISVRNITERKRLEQEILAVATRERNTIGRDLHDGLGQELTGVALMLRGLATRVQRESPGAVGQVNEIVKHVNLSIESARALARGLLPVRNETGGLPFALRALAGRSRDLCGLEVNFRADVRPDIQLSEGTANHLYRIAQEALTNAARHGQASRVEIHLSITGTSFSLRVTDDGVGIGVRDKPRAGMGLKIMKYRAGMIGAKFAIQPNVPRGTVVRVIGERLQIAAPEDGCAK